MAFVYYCNYFVDVSRYFEQFFYFIKCVFFVTQVHSVCLCIQVLLKRLAIDGRVCHLICLMTKHPLKFSVPLSSGGNEMRSLLWYMYIGTFGVLPTVPGYSGGSRRPPPPPPPPQWDRL